MHNISHYINRSFIFVRYYRINTLLNHLYRYIYDTLGHSSSIYSVINLSNPIIGLLSVTILGFSKNNKGIP